MSDLINENILKGIELIINNMDIKELISLLTTKQLKKIYAFVEKFPILKENAIKEYGEESF
jgi:hypothetical protein